MRWVFGLQSRLRKIQQWTTETAFTWNSTFYFYEFFFTYSRNFFHISIKNCCALTERLSQKTNRKLFNSKYMLPWNFCNKHNIKMWKTRWKCCFFLSKLLENCELFGSGLRVMGKKLCVFRMSWLTKKIISKGMLLADVSKDLQVSIYKNKHFVFYFVVSLLFLIFYSYTYASKLQRILICDARFTLSMWIEHNNKYTMKFIFFFADLFCFWCEF